MHAKVIVFFIMIYLISLSRIVNENYYRLELLKTIDFYEGCHRLIRFHYYESVDMKKVGL
ncbi:hypothetical protein AOR13_1895 [Alteromonas stellipolaris LMG 21856]|nr:hypothetical protein AOR13_1895 [Alteromonas stellipolaris LMG 21856]